jgi:predicted kinase
MLSGCSGSGKSTFRAKMLAATPELTQLSSDDYIERWARRDGETYQNVYLKYKDDAKKAVFEKLLDAAAAGRDIVWDQTNLTADARRELLKFVPNEYTLVGVGFEAPLGLTLERVFERSQDGGKSIPEDIVRAQHAGYERPHFDEGFDEVMVVHSPGERIEKIS